MWVNDAEWKIFTLNGLRYCGWKENGWLLQGLEIIRNMYFVFFF